MSRTFTDADRLAPGWVAECVQCREVFDDLGDLDDAETGDLLACSAEACRCVSFILRDTRREGTKITGHRIPKGIAWDPVRRDLHRLGHKLDPPLGRQAKHVAIVLDSYRNANTGLSYPSVETIAEDSGYGTTVVVTTLAWLAEHGYVVRHRNLHGWRGRWGSTSYDLRPLWQAVDAASTGQVCPDRSRNPAADRNRNPAAAPEPVSGNEKELLHVERSTAERDSVLTDGTHRQSRSAVALDSVDAEGDQNGNGGTGGVMTPEPVEGSAPVETIKLVRVPMPSWVPDLSRRPAGVSSR